MSDLIERLRLFEASGPAIPSCQLFGEAADEIQRNRKEIDGLIELLRKDRAEIERLRAVVDEAKQELRDVGSGPGWVAYRILKEADDE